MGIVWVQGHTYTQLPLTLKQSATSALDLTGVSAASITARVQRKDGRAPNVFTALAGSVTIITATAGQITYAFADADVAQAGTYRFLIQAVMPNGKTWKSLPVDFTILQG